MRKRALLMYVVGGIGLSIFSVYDSAAVQWRRSQAYEEKLLAEEAMLRADGTEEPQQCITVRGSQGYVEYDESYGPNSSLIRDSNGDWSYAYRLKRDSKERIVFGVGVLLMEVADDTIEVGLGEGCVLNVPIESDHGARVVTKNGIEEVVLPGAALSLADRVP